MPTFVQLKDGEKINQRPRLSNIVSLAARVWGLSRDQIRARSRKQILVNARHTAFLVASEWFYTQEEMAAEAGLACHTSVCHGINKARFMERYDPQYRDKVQTLRDLVRNITGDIDEEEEALARENRERSVREIMAAIKLEKERADELARRKRDKFDNSDQMFSKQAQAEDDIRDASRDFAARLRELA